LPMAWSSLMPPASPQRGLLMALPMASPHGGFPDWGLPLR
jgi:hypothetical protein